MSPRVQRLRDFWERLAPASLARLEAIYADDVHFRDPFNDVRGRDALRAILAGMFEKLEAPAFRVREAIEEGEGVLLVWDFDFRARGKPWRIHGVSLLRFDAGGRVMAHHDYWDAAGELYAKLPVIGGAFRWLARRFAG